MDNKNKVQALEAVKKSDGRPIIVETLKKDKEALMERFVGDISPEAFDKRWTDLHLIQAQVATLNDIENIIDRIIMSIDTLVEVNNEV